jgi:hypothetical protein
MDNKLYYTKDKKMNVMLLAFSALAALFSIIGVINGSPVLLTVAMVAVLLYNITFNDQPKFFGIGEGIFCVYLLYRIYTLYLKNISTAGAKSLLSPTFAAMVMLLVAVIFAYCTIEGVIKSKYLSLIFIMIAFFLCWYIFVKGLYASSIRGYTYSVPIALYGLYCALIRDRENNGGDVYSIMMAFGVLLCIASVIKAISAGTSTALAIVLAASCIVELGVIFVYIEGHIKSFFVTALIVLFCFIIQISVSTISLNINTDSVKYYFMYAAYICYVIQLALHVLEGWHKNEVIEMKETKTGDENV